MRRWLACLVLLDATAARAEEPSIPSVMDKRWSASMSYGVALVRPRTDDADVIPLFDFKFALHFRMIPTLQIGVALAGAFAPPEGYATLHADLRYSLMAERPWNPYLLGGLGFGFADQSARLFLRAGAGIERRFTSWGFFAEAHLSRVGGDDEIMVDDDIARFGVWSAALGLGVHYHWGGSKRGRRFVP